MRLTPAQRSNFLPPTAWGYDLWRSHALSILSGQPFPLAREARLFLTLAQPRAGQHWLDAGTSTGFYAGLLAAQGCQVDAADLSAAMLAQATRKHPHHGIRWRQMNLETSSLPAATYDGITVGATLNETAHPALFLRELARLLRPGGQVWLMYVGQTGGLGQALLRRFGGLTFPDLAWIERQMPGLRTVHTARFGEVEFALLQKDA